MSKLSMERAIEALYTVRAYYASLTAGYPKGKDCKGIGDVMCSEIANSCLMAIKALEQQPCEDCISREDILSAIETWDKFGVNAEQKLIRWQDHYVPYVHLDDVRNAIANMPSVTPTRPKGKWIHWTDDYKDYVTCSCCGYGEEGEVLLSDKTPFCPICGADMRGETE